MVDTVGFVGVGSMGGVLAEKLLAGGLSVVAYDVAEDARQRVAGLGATLASSPRDVADQAEIVLMSLPSPEISQEVATGEDGLVNGSRVRIVVETSTVGVPAAISMAKALGGKGITMLDAPVSGSAVAAREGALTTMVAGPKAAADELEPIIVGKYAANFFYLAEQVGAGQTVKLVNNAIGITNMLVALEAIEAGRLAGVSPELVTQIINGGSGRSFITDTILEKVVFSGADNGVGPIKLALKDTELFLAAADEIGADVPMATQARRVWQSLVNSGDATRDVLSIFDDFK